MITYKCPHCGFSISVPEASLGMEEICSQCKKMSIVPLQDGEPKAQGIINSDLACDKSQEIVSQVHTLKSLALTRITLVCGFLSFVLFGLLASIPGIIAYGLALYGNYRARSRWRWGWMAAIGLCLCLINVGVLRMMYVSQNEAMRRVCMANLAGIGQGLEFFSDDGQDGGFFPRLSPLAGNLMFDKADIGPDFMNIEWLACPETTSKNISDTGDNYLSAFINDDSYFYLGYAVRNDQDVENFAAAYRDHVSRGVRLEEAVLSGQNGSEPYVLHRLSETCNLLVADNKSSESSSEKEASTIPVLIERLGHHRKAGGSVHYLDGHTSFWEYPGPWPMTKRTMDILESLHSMASGNGPILMGKEKIPRQSINANPHGDGKWMGHYSMQGFWVAHENSLYYNMKRRGWYKFASLVAGRPLETASNWSLISPGISGFILWQLSK
ncbi:MAG TPA: hypothetical protein PLI09_24810 [Candidatus Hydrogenedentes bacterium]|nr:hypothetical protein [Candidatus Hydrogenedentota bacterium]